MASLSRTPDAYGQENSISWSGWRYYDVDSTELDIQRHSGGYGFAAYLIDIGFESTVTAASVEFEIFTNTSWAVGYSPIISCSLYAGGSPYDDSQRLATQTFTISNYSGPVTHKFSFSGVSANTPNLTFRIETATSGNWRVRKPTATATYTLPSLTVGVTPSTLKAGGTVEVNFENRLDQVVDVKFKYSSTTLDNYSIAADGFSEVTSLNWFTTAGVTGNSMNVDVAATDTLGRTASTRFTLTRDALTVGVSPSSVTVGNSAALSFSGREGKNLTVQFKYSSTALYTTTATSDELSVTPDITWFTKAGTSSNMRVDVLVTDTTGRTATTNFQLLIPGLTAGASPSTQYVGSDVAISIGNRLDQTATVVLWYQQVELYRTPATSNQVSIAVDSAWFTKASVSGNSMQVTVAVTDSLGRSASASFTAQKPTGSTATPTNPVNVTKDGTTRFTFDWTYSGNGTQTQAELQYKTQSGDWTALATVNGSTRQYYAAAYNFPVGSISWRVRVTNSYGLVGAWSSAASFTVSYPTLGIEVTPATVYTGKQATISLSNLLSRTATITFVHSGNAVRTPLSVSSESAAVTPSEDWFTAGGETGDTMSVTVTATDTLGRTASDSITVKIPQGSTATPTEPVSVTKSGDSQITFKWNYAGDGYQTQQEIQWKTSSGDWQSLGTVASQSAERAVSAYKFPVGSVSWRVRVRNSFGVMGNWSNAASFTVSYPALSAAVSPASIYINNSGTISFTNRLNRTLTIQYKHSQTNLAPTVTVSADSAKVTPTDDWFTAASFSGSTLSVTAAITDDLGRTATASFSAIKPQASTATPTAPKSTTVDGAETINFAWSVSSDWGAQTKAELQWSPDNAVWHDLITINGSAKTWTAPAVKFPSGTIYWHVRVTNNFGILGEWSSAVNFTVNYSATSQVVPVNSQTSGIFARGAAKTFSARFEASGPVYAPFTFASATFKWRHGTSGTWTEVAMTSADNGVTASVTIAADTFPAGVMQWMIEGTDNTGRTTSTSEYTITAATSAIDITPIRPINTVESGNGEIVFLMGYVSLDGQTPVSGEWAWSTDAQTWETLTLLNEIRDGTIELKISPDTFPAGAIYWRARAKNSADIWGDWSSVVSFKVLDAPVITGVTGDGKPFLTVSWQTPTTGEYGQQAYKVMVDGTLYGPYFGADVRSYALKEPLEDGTHEIKVSAQNRFGLWSEWVTGNVVVTNVPGPSFTPFVSAKDGNAEITMWYATIAPIITRQPQDYQSNTIHAFFNASVKSWRDWFPKRPNIARYWQYRTGANAEWQAYDGPVNVAGAAIPDASAEGNGYQYRVKLSNEVGEIWSDYATFYFKGPPGVASDLRPGEWKAPTGWFMIFRDGKYIGKTYNNEFLDRRAVGTHTYRVIQVLPNGYYTPGVDRTVTISVDCPMIGELDGDGQFIPANYSNDEQQEITITRRRDGQRVYYSGAKYPAVELSEHEELSANFSTFWIDGDDANADELEELLGKQVMLKTPKGRLIVGVLDSLPVVDSSWRRFYTIQLSQMEWRDFVDVT